MASTNSPGHDRFFSSRSDLFFIFILILISTLALFWKLGAGDLAAWDEAIYAQVSKEMAQGGDWLTLHWGYKPWFEKPPLLMWTTALLYRLFGVKEFWARAASALSGIALVVVTYLLGKLAYNKQTGFLAALILLTSYYFLSFSRFGTMDVMLTLFTCLAIYAYLHLRDGNGRWWYMACTACALAVMTKGAGGLIAPAVILLALVFDKRLSSALRSRDFRLGCALALLIVAPWHILMFVWHGRAFADEYLGYHTIARATRTLEGHATTPLYYFGRLIDGFFPCCLLIPFAFVSSIREILRGEHRCRIFLIVSVLVFVVYTLIPTRRPWYIVPIFPALAILIAALIINLHQTYQARPVYRRIIASVCLLLIIVGGFYSALSLYLNRKAEEPVASLARLARSKNPDDRDSLLLFSEAEPFYAQVPLFYSDRPIQQTYAAVKPPSEDAKRYVNFENLSDTVAQDSSKRIIMRQDDMARLSTDYEIQVLAEADSFVYATIRHK
ncbi:MAG: glycosyltransferase family 39 protein [Pyrinomonadaceae bacterium]